MSPDFKERQARPIGERPRPVLSPDLIAQLQRMDRPYRPGLAPWIIGLAVVALFVAAGFLLFARQPPALDPAQAPPMESLPPDAGRVYLNNQQSSPEP